MARRTNRDHRMNPNKPPHKRMPPSVHSNASAVAIDVSVNTPAQPDLTSKLAAILTIIAYLLAIPSTLIVDLVLLRGDQKTTILICLAFFCLGCIVAHQLALSLVSAPKRRVVAAAAVAGSVISGIALFTIWIVYPAAQSSVTPHAWPGWVTRTATATGCIPEGCSVGMIQLIQSFQWDPSQLMSGQTGQVYLLLGTGVGPRCHVTSRPDYHAQYSVIECDVHRANASHEYSTMRVSITGGYRRARTRLQEIQWLRLDYYGDGRVTRSSGVKLSAS